MKQYFEILELQPGATPDEVKRAYRDLAKVWHPDRFKEDSPRLKSKAAEKLTEINEAYEKIRAYQARQKARKQASDQQQSSQTGYTGYRPYNPQRPTGGNGQSYSGYARPTSGRTQTPRSRSSVYSQPNAYRRHASSTRTRPGSNSQNTSNYSNQRSRGKTESSYSKTTNPSSQSLARQYHRQAALQYGPYNRNYGYKYHKRRRSKNPIAIYLAVVALLAVTTSGAYIYIKKSEQQQQPTLAEYPLSATPRPASDVEEPAALSEQTDESVENAETATEEAAATARITRTSRSVPPPSPGMFTIGSSKRDVMKVQGEPEQVRAGLFRYGFSTVFFENDRVSGWHETPDTPLKVELKPSREYTLDYFTLGSTRDEVLAVQGTPDHYRDMGREFRYGESRITFEGGRVTSWHQHANHPLRVRLLPRVSANVDFFTYQSTRDVVLSVQGTPDHFSENTFHYGYSTVKFENDRVVEWNRTPTHPLKVILEPSVPTSSKFFTLGSSQDEVIAAQGTPDQFSEHMFKFGYSTVSFDQGRVVSWYQSAASPLNVRSD